MQGLVRQPVMRLNYINPFPVSEKFKLVKIRMAGKTYGIVISYRASKVFSIPYTDMIRMRVAFPATEFIGYG